MRPRLSAPVVIRLVCAAAAMAVLILLLLAKKPWAILAEIGTPDKGKEFAAIYGWWAGAINATLLAFLALTVPWWMRPASAASPWLPRLPNPRWFWPLVLIAMVITAAAGWQRISYSVWDDEENSLRRVIVGEYREAKDGTYEFKHAG